MAELRTSKKTSQPGTPLTFLYEVDDKYKERRCRVDVCRGCTVRNIFSNPKNGHVLTNDTDIDRIEQLLKEEGFGVLRHCKEAKTRIEKAEGRLLIMLILFPGPRAVLAGSGSSP